MLRCIAAGVLVTYVVAVFQTTLGGKIELRGVSPDLVLVWTLCVGLLTGPQVGALAGFGGGMLEGALGQKLTAAFAISKLTSGFAAGLLATRMFKEHWFALVLAGTVLTLLNELFFLAVSWGWGARHPGHIIAMRMLYHAVLTPLGFALVTRARRSLRGGLAEVG